MTIVAFPAASSAASSAATPAVLPRYATRPAVRPVVRAFPSTMAQSSPPGFLTRSNARSASVASVSPLFSARPWLQDDPAIELGWDHAHYGLRPSLDALGDSVGIRQGYQAGVAVFGRRTLRPSRFVKAWLALRLEALERGCFFDIESVNPRYIEQLVVARCPVTRQPLELGAAGTVIVRLRHDRDYVAGNLMMMSRRAWLDTSRPAFGAGGRLDAADKARLVVLRSFGQALSHAAASRTALLVMPPNRLFVRNPIQALQAVVSRSVAIDAMSTSAAATNSNVASNHTDNRCFDLLRRALPGKSAKDDVDAFEQALTSAASSERMKLRSVRTTQIMRAMLDTPDMPDAASFDAQAIEDAWAHEEVLRCWQALAAHLDARKSEQLAGALAAACTGFGISITPDDGGLPPQRASLGARLPAAFAA